MSEAAERPPSLGGPANGRAGEFGLGHAAAGEGARPRGRLFRKYVLLFVGLVSFVLLVNAAIDFWFSWREEEAAAAGILQTKANSAARRIEAFVDGIERQIGWTTNAEWAASPLEQRRFDFVRLLRQVPAITEVTQLDGAGREQLKVSRLAMDVVGSEADHSHDPAFLGAQAHRVWYGPVYFRKQSEPYMTIAVRSAGRNAGVTVAEVNLKLIWDVVTALKIGEHGEAYVVDGRGRLIADPDISLVLRDTDLSDLPQVMAARTGAAGPVAVARSLAGRRVLTAYAPIERLGWLVFVELPESEALAPLYAAAMRAAGLLLLGLLLATLAALALARRMVVPIRAIAEGAARIGRGELDRRIAIETGDEIEALAGQFNQMAGELQKSYAELEGKVQERTAELSEALEQQTATAEVLGVINSSPGDLAPVFDAMLEKAMRLCDAADGHVYMAEGERARAVAAVGNPEFVDWILHLGPHPLARGGVVYRMMGGEDVVHIPDSTEGEAYRAGTLVKEIIDRSGMRTTLGVALRKDDVLLGAIFVTRREVRPFTDKQIALLQNFAAQAVIAMENARLITETREALEQQTATAEVLQVINSSPGDLAPVFDAILEKAHSLCGATFGELHIFDGEYSHAVAVRNVPEPFAKLLREPFRPPPPLAPLLRGEAVVHIPDVAAFEGPDDPIRRAAIDLGGCRTLLVVALRKDDALLGWIAAYRQEVRPFTDKQIALLQNFAAQAVIAMENARLITETREALEQQTATAEVLGVINSSPGDLAPVFDAILEKAHSLCGATHGALGTFDGEFFRMVAGHGLPEEFAALLRQPFRAYAGSSQELLLRGEPYVQIPDQTAVEQTNPIGRASVALTGTRTLLFIPLRREDALVGYMTAYRREVRPFTDKQIALLQNFAAQAVIAMENARLLTETREALEQQTATAEVLQVINSSPGDLAPVFDAVLEKAMRLCDAAFGNLFVYDGELFHTAAHRGEPAYGEWLERVSPVRPERAVTFRRLLAGAATVHIADVLEDEGYRSVDPDARAAVETSRMRTLLSVPLRKERRLLGSIAVYRQEVRPFTDKQIALLQNFAAQAVIAMENARLITETREALEQQTATAEVLQVINSSPGDLTPVFDAMLDKAMRLCQAAFGQLMVYQAERFRPVAVRGEPRISEWLRRRGPASPGPGTTMERIVRGEGVVQIADVAADAAYRRGDPTRRALVEIGGCRTLLSIALRRDDALLGAITVYRQEVRPFTDKQIALLENFAAQAVIAMENARLITETREALEQQTATAEVLQVINSSPGDLAPVFEAILDKALALCGAAFGELFTFDGERFPLAATRGAPSALSDFRRQNPLAGGPGTVTDELLSGVDAVHISDILETEAYKRGVPNRRAWFELGGARAVLAVALRQESGLLGTIMIYRQEVRPFTDKQIALLQNFAAQAVIAMENARLITETREALEQQTATAEVLGVINSSPGDLAPVFDAMLEKAMRLCQAAFGILQMHEGSHFRTAAQYGVPAALAEFLSRTPREPGRHTAVSRMLQGEDFVQFEDFTKEPAYEAGDPRQRAFVELGGARTYVAVPLRKDGELVGTIAAYRMEVRPFSERQIALLQNFAAQAVIAMENARLITETREALEQQTATAEVLGVINASPGDLAPVFDAMLEKAIRLCGGSFGMMVTIDGDSARTVAARDMPAEFASYLAEHTPSMGPDTFFGRAVIERSIRHTPDMMREAAYRDRQPLAVAAVDVAGVRALLMAPLLKDDTVLGVFAIFRRDAGLFTEKQIAVLQNFAAQAVIAMENARLITETREALEQQTATAEVLGVINSSPGDLAPVFDAILEKAHSLCGLEHGALVTFDGELFRGVATHGLPQQFTELLRQPFRPNPGGPQDRLVRGEAVVHVTDIAASEPQQGSSRIWRAGVGVGGARTILFVPLRKENVLLGYISGYRQEVRPFTDKQIALLQNFAAQAVIAMENARLITETREALDQQTATAEVLQVINSSPGDLAPVWDAMLEKATRLCEAASGILWTYDAMRFRAVAQHGLPFDLVGTQQRDPNWKPTASLEAVAAGQDVVRDDDLGKNRGAGRAVELGGMRTGFLVALRKGDELLGAIRIFRKEARPFTDKQITLVQNFAAQAVIAIENARLITETREALEQQTATAEVLQVINSSPGELAPVFDEMVEKATRLCEAAFGILLTYDGERFHHAALRSIPAAYAEFMREHPPIYGPGTAPGRLAAGERLVHVVDMTDTDAYRLGDQNRRAIADLAGARSLVAVPLRKDGQLLGAIVVFRQEVRPFTDKQIALLENFAAQAVIAMENARLLGELRERTAELGRSVEELKTLSEVGQAVSSTLDLRSVLSTVLTRSVGLTGVDAGAIFRHSRAEHAFRLVEAVGWEAAPLRSVRDLKVAEDESALGEAAAKRMPIQLPDLARRPRFPLRDASVAAGLKSALVVPLVGPERVLGAIVLQRRATGEFPPETVRLMQTLASQSVLAIQNARMFRELAQKSEELELASQHKSQFLANMSHELRTPLNAILGYAELLVDGVYGEMPERPKGVLERVQNNGRHLLALINDVLDLAKIEAGQLTLSLEDYSVPELVRSVVGATEPLASAKGLKFAALLPDDMPTAHGDARRISQVLLNLVGNAIKFTDAGEVEIRAAAADGHFILTVRDTGPGIAEADQERIFGEFQQIDNSNTRKKGGTGLGLAISKRMVEMQGGTIAVESALGEGSTFRVTLPVHVEGAVEG